MSTKPPYEAKYAATAAVDGTEKIPVYHPGRDAPVTILAQGLVDAVQVLIDNDYVTQNARITALEEDVAGIITTSADEVYAEAVNLPVEATAADIAHVLVVDTSAAAAKATPLVVATAQIAATVTTAPAGGDLFLGASSGVPRKWTAANVAGVVYGEANNLGTSTALTRVLGVTGAGATSGRSLADTATDLATSAPAMATLGAGVTFLSAGTGADVRTLQDKLREWLSVKDFSAAGDGSADDSAKINEAAAAAYAAGQVLLFPAGTYICKNLQLYPNARWISFAGATLKLKANSDAGDCIAQNVNNGTDENGSDAAVPGDENFSIVGLTFDGNKANQTNACDLLKFRRARYGWIKNNNFINAKGDVFDFTNAIDQLFIENNVFRNNNGIDIAIRWVSNRDLICGNIIIGANLPTVDGGEAGSVTSDAILISATNNTGAANFDNAEMIIDGNIIKGKVRGIVLEGVFDSKVTNNVLGTQTGISIETGPSATYQTIGVDISHNTINCEASGIDGAIKVNGKRIVVAKNAITTISANGVYIPTGQSSELTIDGNKIHFTAAQDVGSGIYVRDLTESEITNNSIRNARNGIHIDSPSSGVTITSITIDGNKVYSSNRSGIRIENGGALRHITYVFIDENIIHNTGLKEEAVYDAIFIEQSGGDMNNIVIGPNRFIDKASLTRDAIRVNGTVPNLWISPDQYVRGVSGVIATGYYSAAPSDGTWKAGARVHFFTPAAGQPDGAVCVTAGSPGTWKTFAAISA